GAEETASGRSGGQGLLILGDVEDRSRCESVGFDALAVLRDPLDLESVPGGHIGDPIGRAFVDLDLHDCEVGPDVVPFLSLGTEVEVTVAHSHTMVEGRSNAEVVVLS